MVTTGKSRGRWILTRGGIALLVLPALLLAAGVGGCVRRPARPVEPPQAEAPPQVVAPSPPEPVPPPTASELAAAAAGRAESYGIYAQAATEYERAASLAETPEARAESNWALARLWADPRNPARDIEKARAACLAVQASGPAAPRQREARVLQALIEELTVARGAALGLKGDLDASRSAEANLREELKKKDQELDSIKRVLLEKKP